MKSVSATQIKQHQACPMQWYLQRVEGWEMPPSASQELGTRVHSEMEAWLLEGKIPEHGSARYMATTLAALREREVIVEEPKDYDMTMTCAGVPVKGRIDVLILPKSESDSLVVLDWKTSSNLKWAMTSDQLSRDTQGVLYLEYAYALGLARPSDLARFDHAYILTKGTGGTLVKGEALDRQTVGRLYRGLESEVERMKATETTPIGSVPGNLKTCDKYGGCAFRDRCPAANQVGLIELLGKSEGEPVGKLSDLIAARKAALANAGVLPPDAPEPAPLPVAAEPVLGQAEKPEDDPHMWVAPVAAVEEERPKSVIEVTYSGTDAPKTDTGLVLYVDCAPDNGGYRYIEAEVAERTPSLLEHLRKTSPKDVPEGAADLGEVLFGRGLAALAASFVVKPVTGHWVLSSSSTAGARVLEVLTPKASKIIRGRRA